MPDPAAIVKLNDLQADSNDPTSTIISWTYKLYFCGADLEEQGAITAPAGTTQDQIKALVNAVIVGAAAEKGFVLDVDRIYTSSSICGV